MAKKKRGRPKKLIPEGEVAEATPKEMPRRVSPKSAYFKERAKLAGETARKIRINEDAIMELQLAAVKVGEVAEHRAFANDAIYDMGRAERSLRHDLVILRGVYIEQLRVLSDAEVRGEPAAPTMTAQLEEADRKLREAYEASHAAANGKAASDVS